MRTFADFARRWSQFQFAKIVGASLVVVVIDWLFGLAAFLGLAAAWGHARLWQSDARLHNRVFAPALLVALVFGPVRWGFETLIGVIGSQLIERSETSMAMALAGLVAIIGVGAAAPLSRAMRPAERKSERNVRDARPPAGPNVHRP